MHLGIERHYLRPLQHCVSINLEINKASRIVNLPDIDQKFNTKGQQFKDLHTNTDDTEGFVFFVVTSWRLNFFTMSNLLKQSKS